VSAYLTSSVQVDDLYWLLHYYSCTELHLSAVTANRTLLEEYDHLVQCPRGLDLTVLDSEVEKDL